ncbi:MAG: FKBP-type peptidyl-prolyl cis-trans isomerase [Myxococcota bacterium]
MNSFGVRLAPVVTCLVVAWGGLACGPTDNTKAQKDQATGTGKVVATAVPAKKASGTPMVQPKKDVKPPIPAPADVAAPPADAEKTESGLASKVLTKGTGTERPGPDDRVKVHYTGWTKDGKMFDSSVQRGQPTDFPLNRVIKGWTEGLQLMVQGEKRRFWIPADLAYGDTPKRPGAPSGQLTFDVELIEVMKPPPPPENLNAPEDATKTKSGLAYKKLSSKDEPGKKPTAEDRVQVHYTGWTQTDGKMFDSSVTRGRPTSFPVNGVIKGWTEGLQLMAEGDKYRLWIPADLAYGAEPKRPGAPAGDLVFDVELIKILPARKTMSRPKIKPFKR